VSTYLLVDIGAGTMDVLYWDDESGRQYKAVVASPVIEVANQIASTEGNLLLTGLEMGGGAVTRILKERANTASVVIADTAAATLNHRLDKVTSWGLKVVPDEEAQKSTDDASYSHIVLTDLDLERLQRIVAGFGVPFSFDILAVCAQDHGVPPKGISHLDYRHNCFVDILDKSPYPHKLLYDPNNVPREMNRLKSILHQALKVSAEAVYVMDSGMAAILGANTDETAQQMETKVVLDVATSHTVGAVMTGSEIAGFFEYHTQDITRGRLEALIRDLANGDLSHEQILAEGGHGCYLRQSVGYENVTAIIATGPKRDLVRGANLPIVWGAPLGDNMMTGNAGMLAAIKSYGA
jgi:uncharacterized protein (DUF1786 family)